MMKPSRYRVSCLTAKSNALLLLLCVSFGQMVPVASSSNNQSEEAQSSSLLLTPGPDSIFVSWTPDDRVNGTGSNYTVAWSTDGRRRGELFVREREERVQKITGLKPCTTYDISVTASDGSEPILNDSTTSLVKEPLKAVGLAANNITAHSLALSWERPATACEITAYNITYYGVAKWGPEHTGSSTIGRGEANSTTTIVIVGLQPYTEYTVTMAAYTAAGEGEVTNITTTTLEEVPSKPTDVRTNSEVSNTIIVTWEKPKQIPGVLGRYSISWHRNTQTVGQDVITSPMYAITSLSPCVEYTVRVAATTGAGEGNYEEITQMTGKAPTMSAPANCSYNSKNKTLSLTWTKPESNCNISSYKVLWTHDNGTNVTSTDEDMFFTTNTSVATGRICVAAVVGKEEGQWRCCDYSAGTDKSGWMISVAISFVASVALIATVAGIMQLIRRKKTKTRRRNSISSLTPSEHDYYGTLLANIKENLEPLKNKKTLAAEFDDIKKASFDGETTVGQVPANRKKNRYNNMAPFDISRVCLRKDGNDSSDYINASFVESCVENDVNFIACQGPLSNTVTDFWWMVWEQDVKTIVMLLRGDEGEKSKCFQYWPEFKEELFSPFIVTLQSRQIVYGLIKRELLLKKGSEVRNVRHFQFISWPDFGVPNSENELLMLVGDVRDSIKPGESNIVVHCSAGVGRTGTFIALWQLQVQADRRLQDINIRDTVLWLRQYRQMLVQKPAQYHYLHVCFIAYLEDIGMWRRPKGRAKPPKREPYFRSLFSSTPNLPGQHIRRETPPIIRQSTMIQNDFQLLSCSRESQQPENIALLKKYVPQVPDKVNECVNTAPRQADIILHAPEPATTSHEINQAIEINDSQRKFPIECVINGPNSNAQQISICLLPSTNHSEPFDVIERNNAREQPAQSAFGNPIYYTNFTDEKKVQLGAKKLDESSRDDGKK